MGSLILVAVFPVILLILSLYRRYARISVRLVPGPEPESLLLGNMRELFQCQASEADFKWQHQYGDIVRLKAAFGEDQLLVSDPKALQYIYQTSGYKFPKQKARREISRMISGRGILWSDGDVHKRHRRVMLPGFGGMETKGFLPTFSACAEKLTTKLRDLIDLSNDGTIVVNINSWTARATLDAIGEVAFDCHFGALDNAHNTLGQAYQNLLHDSFGQPSKADILTQDIMQYLPTKLLNFLCDNIPSKRLGHLRQTARLVTTFAQSLVEAKVGSLLQGNDHDRRDILSLLVKANISENPRRLLNNEELYSQMRSIVFAGHETIATTLSWTLLELSRHPEVQTKLRREIRHTEGIIRQRRSSSPNSQRSSESRGDPAISSSPVAFTSADYDAMTYLTAVLKEGLRYHPAVIHQFREAARDDILPLSNPITLSNGDVIEELPIPKGMKIITSIGGYNRNKDVFGSDAHTFDPERWLDPARIRNIASVGVYGNLLSFSAGVRSCIGWRFAIQELQVFLVELISNFEFSTTEESSKIRREACLIMVPTIEGQFEKGCQLPLRVAIASRGFEGDVSDS